jgi:isorenieratene synthase
MAYDAEATVARYDHLTAKEYLDRLGFPPKARQMLFDVFAHSFFNPEEDFSAAELILMMHFYFLGNREGIVFDVVDGPLLRQDLRAAERLPRRARRPGPPRPAASSRSAPRRTAATPSPSRAARGAAPTRSCSPSRYLPFRPSWSAHPSSETPRGGRRCGGRASPCRSRCGGSGSIAPSPRSAPRSSGPPASACSTTSPSITSSRTRAAPGPTPHGGAVVELHAYAVPEAADEAAIKADLLAQLHAVYPETRGARDRRGALPPAPRLPGVSTRRGERSPPSDHTPTRGSSSPVTSFTRPSLRRSWSEP